MCRPSWLFLSWSKWNVITASKRKLHYNEQNKKKKNARVNISRAAWAVHVCTPITVITPQRRPTYKLHWLYFVLCFINFFHKVFLYKFRRRYSSITFHYNCEKGTQKFARFCCICFFVFVSLSFSKLFRRNPVWFSSLLVDKLKYLCLVCVWEQKKKTVQYARSRFAVSKVHTQYYFHSMTISNPYLRRRRRRVVCCCLLLTRCCCL